MLSGKRGVAPCFVQQSEMHSQSTKRSRDPCRGGFSTHGSVLQMQLTLEEADEQKSLLLSNRSLLRGMHRSAVTMEALVRACRNLNPGVSKQFLLNTHPDTTNTHHTQIHKQRSDYKLCLDTKHAIQYNVVQLGRELTIGTMYLNA